MGTYVGCYNCAFSLIHAGPLVQGNCDPVIWLSWKKQSTAKKHKNQKEKKEKKDDQ